MRNLQTLTAICLLASTFAAAPVLSIVPAIAHDGGHGGGGDHGGGFGGQEHSEGFEGGRSDFNGGHFDNRGDIDRSDRVADRSRDRGLFFDSFGDDQDDCYPEWGYNHQQHPFRSTVCPD